MGHLLKRSLDEVMQQLEEDGWDDIDSSDECPPGLCDKTDSDNWMLENYTEGCRHWKGYHKDPYRGNYKRVVILLGPDHVHRTDGIAEWFGCSVFRSKCI